MACEADGWLRRPAIVEVRVFPFFTHGVNEVRRCATGLSYLKLDLGFGRGEGRGLVEYALIISLAAVSVLAVVSLLGPQQNANTFKNISNNM
jgi:hypothetical protein